MRWAVRSCCSVDTRAYPTNSSFILPRLPSGRQTSRHFGFELSLAHVYGPTPCRRIVPVGRSACETDVAECAPWISFGSRSSSTLTIRSRLVDGGPTPWAGLSWATPRTSSRSGRLRIGCRACCSCRFWRRRQARTDSILTSVRSIKPQKSNVSFPSLLGGPMSGSVTRRGLYSPTLKAMSSASFVDGFGPIPRSRRHRTTRRSASRISVWRRRWPYDRLESPTTMSVVSPSPTSWWQS